MKNLDKEDFTYILTGLRLLQIAVESPDFPKFHIRSGSTILTVDLRDYFVEDENVSVPESAYLDELCERINCGEFSS